MVISANLGWLLSFDNLSTIPPAMSDALCKLSTEGGFSTRKLYTDDEETSFNVRRPIMMNGIETLIHREDLLDRSIVIQLEPITKENRIEESILFQEFKENLPTIFEGLLSALVVGMRRLDSVHVPLERMADFCRWGAAVAPAVGWSEEEYLKAFQQNQCQSMESNYETDPVYTAIEGILDNKSIIYGTATEILKEIIHFFGKSIPKDLPRTARGLVSHITRIRPNLRKHGIVHIPPKGLSHHDRRHTLKKARRIQSLMRDGA